MKFEDGDYWINPTEYGWNVFIYEKGKWKEAPRPSGEKHYGMTSMCKDFWDYCISLQEAALEMNLDNPYSFQSLKDMNIAPRLHLKQCSKCKFERY